MSVISSCLSSQDIFQADPCLNTTSIFGPLGPSHCHYGAQVHPQLQPSLRLMRLSLSLLSDDKILQQKVHSASLREQYGSTIATAHAKIRSSCVCRAEECRAVSIST